MTISVGPAFRQPNHAFTRTLFNPRMVVEKKYEFDGPNHKLRLLESRPQSIVCRPFF
jgi:hypothetical protein